MVGRNIVSNAVDRDAGFTLLEVMIVVALVAILSAIAFPTYIDYIVRANRAAAQGFTLEVANRQERFLLDNRGYAATIAALGVTVPSSVSANYTVTTTSPRAVGIVPPSYSVDAVPSGNQATRDAKCGTLTIDETGAKSVTGSSGVAGCWRQ